ncbi:MAG: patatin-like phospholipase family protein [Leptospiraceae bacterium]|nr:patatin-like phospholipase family protein [Leptospiraceae bacterium]MCK6382393.1 patatin-like phospholipase family protein [Leptospiraceae bacterium]NUM42128.1 patatin-like phospholipase family protein [Leptospiraceae bacterium]
MIEKASGFMKNKKKALIVEGGGMKGTFAGGALAIMSNIHPSHHFDIVVGVSSGSCSAAYYVTHGVKDTSKIFNNLNVWRHELSGKKLINFLNPLKGKTFLNQEYLVDFLFGEKYPLPLENLDQKKAVPFYIVVSNMKTMLPEYIRITSKNILSVLKAATAVPIATKGKHTLGDKVYSDGALLDPIPIEPVLDAGYKDITVVLNNPIYHKAKKYSKWLSNLSFPGNKQAIWAMQNYHHVRYNRAMEILNNPPKDVTIKVIAPDEKLPTGLLVTDTKKLNLSVDLGMEAAKKFFQKNSSKIKNFLESVQHFHFRN